MNEDTFTAFVIDEALDELAPEVRELWQTWLREQPERQRERDEILAALEATRGGVERDSAFLHPADDDLAEVVARTALEAVPADSRPDSGARVLPFPAARPSGSQGLSLVKQVAALALLLVAVGSGYLAGSRSAPAPAPLAEAAPSVPAPEPELEPAAPSLVGAWARYHWSLESDESTVSLRQAPGTDPL